MLACVEVSAVVGVQRGAALVPEIHPPVRPALYVAVCVPPPLDTDTSEGGRSAHVGSTSSDVLPQVQLPAASYTTASTGPYMSGARPDSGVFASRC